MAETWRSVLEELGLDIEEADAPEGESGEWYAVVSVFGTHGFVRILVQPDDDALGVHGQLAPPPGGEELADDVAARLSAQTEAPWETAGEKPPFDLRGVVAGEEGLLREVFIDLLELADALREDDADAFRTAVEELGGDEDDVAEEGEADSEESDEAEDSGETSQPSGGAFEQIGTGEPAEPDGNFEFDVAVSDDEVHLGVALGSYPEAYELDAFAQTVIRNLRGKFDVDVDDDLAAPDSAAEPGGTGARLFFRLEPAPLEGTVDLDAVAAGVDDYFATIRDLARNDVDPFVFLGVRTAKSREEKDRDAQTQEESSPDSASPFEKIGDGDAPSLPASDDAEGSGVTLDLAPSPDADDPLEPGQFEDPRLDRSDATTPLVDVVLRHPGFSDRNIGQVLSILLSIDYHAAVEISDHAPTVVAWGVSRERGQTFKTVVEGAGGKILLVEPDTFPEG